MTLIHFLILAHEKTEPRRRVRVEDEADPVKFVSITNNASNHTNPTDSNFMADKRPARPTKFRSTKDSQNPSPANKAAVQLMSEAKLLLHCNRSMIWHLASELKLEEC